MRDLVVNGKHYHLNEIGNAAIRENRKQLGQYKGSIPARRACLALKPREDITKSQKRGISGPAGRTYVLQKVLKRSYSPCQW